MSSIVIVVKSDKAQATINGRMRLDTTEPRKVANALSNFFHSAAGGLENCSITVQSSATDPVRASGTATVAYATLIATDTVTIGGQVLTCVTGTPTTAQYKKETDGTVTAVNLAAAINAHATLSQIVSATSALAVVTISANVSGVIGNLVATVSSGLGVVMGAAVLASGAGGATNPIISYSRGIA